MKGSFPLFWVLGYIPPLPMDVGLSPMFFPIVLGVAYRPWILIKSTGFSTSRADIAEISSNSDGDTWSFHKAPDSNWECSVVPLRGRYRCRVLSHCFGCWVKSHPLPPSNSKEDIWISQMAYRPWILIKSAGFSTSRVDITEISSNSRGIVKFFKQATDLGFWYRSSIDILSMFDNVP